MIPTLYNFSQTPHQAAVTTTNNFTSSASQAQSPHTPTNLVDKKHQSLSPDGSAGSDSVSSSSSNNSLIFTPPTVQQVCKQQNHDANHISNIPNQQTPSFPSTVHQKSVSPPPRPPRTPQFSSNGKLLARNHLNYYAPLGFDGNEILALLKLCFYVSRVKTDFLAFF